jgi:hypothetical protein
MRACCMAQDVIVLRRIQNGEVLCPRRGSNPARMTLTTKRYVGRAEIFAPADDLSAQNSVHFKSNQTYGAPLAS